MSDYPIIFSAPMVRALLDGRKTQTRRLAWHDNKKSGENYVEKARPSPWQHIRSGDRLWVRETWRRHHDAGGVIHDATGGQMDYIEPEDHIEYRAACKYPANFKWRSPLHLPRTHSRLTLIVTATKIERLQEIGEADANAEGVTPDPNAVDKFGYPQLNKFAFADLWEGLHGPNSWDANPEVVALTFEVHKSNIYTLNGREG